MNPFSLEDRHIVVTGAGRGLGRAIALAVAHAGATVTLVARTESQLTETKVAISRSGGFADLRCTDLSDLDAVNQLARELSSVKVDGIVHAAGITHRANALDFGTDELERVLRVNMEAPFLLSRELMNGPVGHRPTSHVFIGSLGSSIGIPRAVAYVASKSALLGVVRTLSTEWAALGVRVNAISPGYFYTELTAEVLNAPESRALIEGRIPMGRLGLPEELGGAAIFLLSEASSYVTGQQIIVDGGWLAS